MQNDTKTKTNVVMSFFRNVCFYAETYVFVNIF